MGTIVKVGNIASGEKNVDNKDLRQKLHNKLDAIACNWEKALEIMFKALNKFIFEG